MNWKELIVSEIDSTEDALIKLDLDKGTVRYSSRIRQNLPIHRITEDAELVRAYMVHQFMSNMGYSPESLELDRPYKVGQGGETVTVGVVVNDEDGNPFFFATAMAPDEFERGKGAESRLFLAAEKEFELTGKVVRHLFYFTVKVENGRLSKDSMIIDYSHFHRLSDWDRLEKRVSGLTKIKWGRLREVSRRSRKIAHLRYRNRRFSLFIDKS